MSAVKCDPHLLQQLITGELEVSSESPVIDHLNACVDCQRTVEELAGGETWLRDSQLYLSPENEQAWSNTLIILPDGVDEESEEDDVDFPRPISLDFLAPTDDPESLGRLGLYEVKSVIGRGGAGIVVKAFDRGLNRFVAIKVLDPHLASNAAARRRFARESQAAAAVVHEHIVPIHAVSDQQGLPYIVMQYVGGQSLQQRLNKHGPLSLREVLRIGFQTASGLAAAHAQGLVHRDIKPANILLENGVERVLVTDFGLARTMDDASLTRSGVIAGTPQYMAPEQARGDAIDYRADLFSLGSVLYTMCTGHSPFRAETTMGVLHRICEATPRLIQESNPDIPLWMSAIITKLLSKNPARRYSSASEVATLLQRQLSRLQSHPESLSWNEVSLSTSAWIERRRASIAFTVVAALMIIVGVMATNRASTPKTDITHSDQNTGTYRPESETSRSPAVETLTQQSNQNAQLAVQSQSPSTDQTWHEQTSQIREQIQSLDRQFHLSPRSQDRWETEVFELTQQLVRLGATTDDVRPIVPNRPLNKSNTVQENSR